MNDNNFSELFEKFNIDKNSISPDMINNLLGMLNNTNVAEGETHKEQSSSNNIDFENILRMKSIIEKMNSREDPRSNLLLSLKPYLKESRQDKVDQYIQLLNMSKILEVFPFMGGDKKNDGEL
ncbi:MAG: hypothetical protein IJN50_04880 [Clostridia bacterium]|nr:hypothetical protein [Clostridia bacterium]